MKAHILNAAFQQIDLRVRNSFFDHPQFFAPIENCPPLIIHSTIIYNKIVLEDQIKKDSIFARSGQDRPFCRQQH